MPSPLVSDVRRRLAEEGRPLTTVERVLLLATLTRPGTGAEDVVDELGDAIAELRRTVNLGRVDPLTLLAIHRMLAAARAVLDHEPPPPAPDHAALPERLRPWRIDVDG